MTRSSLLPFAALLLTVGIASPAASQEQPSKLSVEKPSEKSSRHYSDSMAPKPKKSLARQKSEYRGLQRTARLESLRRRGISIARPTVYGLPFTNSYRPSQRSYYYGRQPIVIIRRY